MSLRIEQNWKWQNKTFPHTLCVVSTSDETTYCGICVTSVSSGVPFEGLQKFFVHYGGGGGGGGGGG